MRVFPRKHRYFLHLVWACFLAVMAQPVLRYPPAVASDSADAARAAFTAYRFGALSERSHYPPTEKDAYVWHSYTIPAGNGLFRYGFEFDWLEGWHAETFTLHTNAGPISVTDFGGGTTSRATRNAEVLAGPLDALHIHSLEINGKPASLDLLASQDDEATRYPWEIKKAVFEKNVHPSAADPRLSGKRLRLTVSPTRPVNMGVGIYTFILVGEEGFPPLESVRLTYLKPSTEGRFEEELTVLRDKDGTPGAHGSPWSCQMTADCFMQGGQNDPFLVVPEVFVLASAMGVLKGETVELLNAIDIVSFERIPVLVENSHDERPVPAARLPLTEEARATAEAEAVRHIRSGRGIRADRRSVGWSYRCLVPDLILREDGSLWFVDMPKQMLREDGSLWFADTPICDDEWPEPEEILSEARQNLAGLTGIIAIGAGKDYYVALTHSGDLLYGETIHGFEKMLGNVRSFSAGFDFVLAVTNDDVLWGWGDNYSIVQIDRPFAERKGRVERPVPLMRGVRQAVATRQDFPAAAVAWKTDGSLWGWGAYDSVDREGDIALPLAPGMPFDCDAFFREHWRSLELDWIHDPILLHADWAYPPVTPTLFATPDEQTFLLFTRRIWAHPYAGGQQSRMLIDEERLNALTAAMRLEE